MELLKLFYSIYFYSSFKHYHCQISEHICKSFFQDAAHITSVTNTEF